MGKGKSGKKDNIQEKVSDEIVPWMKKHPASVTKNSIVAYFDLTDPPIKDSDIFCPHFWELKPFNGCRFNCQWCYLNGTLRFTKKAAVPKDTDEIEKKLTRLLEVAEEPLLLNAGEVSDGMLFPSILLRTVIPVIRKYRDKGHKLLILTKDTEPQVIRQSNSQEITIFAYSINAIRVSDQYEIGAPDPLERLEVSRIAHDNGYRTRLRLDPMVPIPGWKEAYTHIIKEICRINPYAEVITLGTLRGLQRTISEAEAMGNDMTWKQYLSEDSSWGKRTAQALCVEMYSHAIKELRKYGYKGQIALCKETLGVWKALKEQGIIDYGPGDVDCNCTMNHQK